MSRGLNKATLIGHLGADPETKYMPSGKAVTNFRLATGEAWTDRDTGERQERTEWHNCTAFGKVAEIAAEYLRKGGQVYVEGRLRTRKWQDRDGNDRYTTEVNVDQLLLLGGGRQDQGARPAGEQKPAGAAPASAEPDDHIPF